MVAMVRVPWEEFVDRVTGSLVRGGVSSGRARRLAELYGAASADGVHSHGAQFIPVLRRWLRDGTITETEQDPEWVAAFGALERYDGRRGFGALNAEFCMDRALELAATQGVGAVALRNTGHWGRPGNYGWQAANRGMVGICWSNTEPMMPAWGGRENAVGNNPLVLAAPGAGGAHVVVDLAMSQFAWGKLNLQRLSGEPLPVPGGVDARGVPTTDAAAILDGGRMWPMGFWKGSSLAIVLDVIAASLADGRHTGRLSEPVGLSQVFIALAPDRLGGTAAAQHAAEVVAHLAHTNPEARYPGQAALAQRAESARLGVAVREALWAEICAE